MSAAMRHSLTSRLAAKARAEAEALAAEVSRRKKITAAMEEAKKAAAKRREEALERLAKEEADLAKATKASLSTADAGPDAMDPGARASTDPAPARPPRVPPLQKTNGRRYPAQWLSPRPGAGRSGSRASAPRAPLTRQAIQTPRSGAIFSLTATCTFERDGGRCRRGGCSPRLLASAEAPASSSSGGQARANAKPQGKGQFTLDLTWTAIDRDLWPLGSWNKSLGEHGPKPRYEGPKGKGKSLLPERAIWHGRNNPEVANGGGRQLVCRHPPATSPRAEYLATELLPRGCYFDPLDLPLRTAVGHWDPDNAIFRLHSL